MDRVEAVGFVGCAAATRNSEAAERVACTAVYHWGAHGGVWLKAVVTR